MQHVMIDLETLSIRPQAVFMTIGACLFNPDTGEIGKTFYLHIDWDSACKGRHIEPSTLKWWFSQSEDATKEILKHGSKIEHVLSLFSDWLPKNCFVWGNGATFDISILEDAYRQYNMEIPWKFWNIRDVRTINHLSKIDKKDFPFEGTPHHALDDAIHQAKFISMVWQTLTTK